MRVSGLSALLLICLLGPVSRAAEGDLTLTVDPERIYPGQPLSVTGFVRATSATPSPVELQFLDPAGEKSLRTTTPAPDGAFSLTFDEAKRPGRWEVSVTAKGRTVRAEFHVALALRLAILAPRIGSADEQALDAFRTFRAKVVSYPDFPEKDRMLANLDEMIGNVEQVDRVLATVKRSGRDLDAQLATHGGELPAEAHAVLGRVASISGRLVAEYDRAIPAIRSEIQAAEAEFRWCAHLKRWGVALKKVSFLMKFAVPELTAIAQAFGKDALTKHLPSDMKATVALLEGAFVAATGPAIVPLFLTTVGTTLNVADAIVETLFKKHCTEFRGDVTGAWSARLLHGGTPFFTVRYEFKAEAWLVFQTRKPGDPAVHLGGEMEGRITDVSSEIDMRPFELPSVLVAGWARAPLPRFGSRTFRVEIEGKATHDLLEIKLKKVVNDFDLWSEGWYVMPEGATGIPIPGHFTFPLMDMEWVFTRTTKLSLPDVEYFETPITVYGDRSVARGSADRSFEFPETPRRKAVKTSSAISFELSSPPK
ncbi:MAG: hypothetical protein ACYTEZ_17860 [Planctomycetota bacterium]